MLAARVTSHLSELRQQYSNFITSGLNLILLFIGLKFETREGWMLAFSLVALTSFLAWASNIRRFRLIEDTPTSKVVSAAQGYIELFGRGDFLPGDMLLSRLTSLPCLWFRYSIERKTSDNKWELIDHGISLESFSLDDETGQCVIDPELAEIITVHKKVWREGDLRNTEYLLLPGDELYAIGEHATLGGPNTDLDLKGDVSALLAEWKRDKKALLERFDSNADGQIDLTEWEHAVREAKQEVEQQHREIRLQDGVHILRKPKDGRLFLISNMSPTKLAKKYRIWAWVHLAFVLSAVVAFGVAAS